jgi:hypothetical protein
MCVMAGQAHEPARAGSRAAPESSRAYFGSSLYQRAEPGSSLFTSEPHRAEPSLVLRHVKHRFPFPAGTAVAAAGVAEADYFLERGRGHGWLLDVAGAA